MSKQGITAKHSPFTRNGAKSLATHISYAPAKEGAAR